MTVEAKTIAVESISLNKTITKKVGETEQLTAIIKPDNATNKAVAWKSDKPAIAAVDSNGKVTAKAVGTAKITVTTKDGNKTAQCTVIVEATAVAVTGVSVDKYLNLKIGQTKQLKATITPSNATMEM